MTTKIRPATPDDLAEMVRISNSYIEDSHINFACAPESVESWRSQTTPQDDRYPAFVAVSDGAVIGFARALPWKSRSAYAQACEVSIYVDRAHHGCGVGRLLYTRLFPAIQAAGFHSAMAGIALPNDASINLHESFGMTRVGTFREVGRKFDQWWDVGYWQRFL